MRSLTVTPNLETRAGRMLAAGKVTITVKSLRTGNHITVRFSCKKKSQMDWENASLEEASHCFVTVPNSTGFGDKVGTFYPQKGIWYDSDHSDPARVAAAMIALKFVEGTLHPQAECKEDSRCGKCGRELTDPISIDRGIGPECAGRATGSVHQVKVKARKEKPQPSLALAVANGW